MSHLNREAATRAWNAAPPDWIVVLADECDRINQSAAAKILGVSAAMVNQALKNAYQGNLSRLETRVRGEFMKQVVFCPVLGEINSRDCQDHAGAKFSATNPLRVQLYKACRTCPNNRRNSENKEHA
jgi:hypothetical protein